MNDLYRQLLFYATFCWRRRGLALATAWTVCVVGWTIVAFLPDQYAASGKVYVETRSVLQPLLKGLAVDLDVEGQVAMMQQTLLSRPNLEEVARRTDLDVSADSPAEMDILLEDLRRRISVSGARKDLFSISVVDTKPRRAKETVDALVSIFVETNLGQSRTDMDSAEKFLVGQLNDYEKKLQEAERRLAQFKQANMDYFPAQGSFQQQLYDARRRVEEAEFELSDKTRERDIVRRELGRTPQVLTFESGGVASPDTRALRLAELQESLYGLLSKFTEQHPDVVALRQEIQRLQSPGDAWQPVEAANDLSASGSSGESSARTSGIANIAHMQLKLHLVEAEAAVSRAREQVARHQASLQKLERMAQRGPEIEAEEKRLNRDYGVIKANYEQLLERRESARISQDRETGMQLAKFRIVEPPQVPTAPEGPDRMLLLTAVIPIAAAAGIGLTILLPLLRDSYFDMRRLRSDFGLAVVGAVSYVRKPRAMWGSLRLVAFAGGLAALVLAYGLLLSVEAKAGLGTVARRSVETGSLQPVVTALRQVAGAGQSFIGLNI